MPSRRTHGGSTPEADRPATPGGCSFVAARPHVQDIQLGLLDADARLSAARNRAVLAAALDPIVTMDAFGTILSASDSVRRVFGWTPEELLKENIKMLMPDPHRSEHDGYLANYRRTGKTNILGRTREFEGVRKGGERFPIEISIARVEPVGSGDHTPGLFVGILRDVSERKRAEAELEGYRRRLEDKVEERSLALQESQDRLRLADRLASIGTLAAGLGHDMNNVLLPVRAHLNALRASARPGSPALAGRKHVEEIAKGVAYLQQLADGLHFLAMNPEMDGDARSGADSTDLRQWWSQTGVLLSKAVPKHVRVTASLPAGLPRVAVAAHRLTQAVLNLIVNAGEAIPSIRERKRREGRVRVWAESDPASATVRLGVTDNGRGMSAEVRHRAFEMFFTTKTRGLGTGLGLALVNKVATGAGGRVDVESEVGKGTTVVMVLKCEEDDTKPGIAPLAAVSVGDGRSAALIKQILEAGGARIATDSDSSTADIWVIDPAQTAARAARAWRDDHPRGRLVLFGTPAGARPEWARLGAITVDRRDDFDGLRAGLGRALKGD